MAERQIEIVIKASDLASAEVDGVISKITGISPKSEKVSKDVVGHSGLMRLGMFSVGESVEYVTGQFGIMGKAGRQVGNVVEGMIGGLGTFGRVLGGATIVVGGAVMVWRYFADAQQKHREEMLKSADAMLGMISNYDKLSPAVRRLADAQYDLAEAERKLKLLNLAEAIQLQGEEAEKARDKHERMTAALLSGGSGEISVSKITESIKKIGLESDTAQAKLKVLTEQWNVFNRPQQKPGGSDQKDQDALLADIQNFKDRELAIGKTGDELKLLQMQQHHAAEIAQLTKHGADSDQIETAKNVQRLEREQAMAAMILQVKQQEAQMELTVQRNAFQAIDGLLSLYASQHRSRANAIFLIQKALAIAQIWVDTSRAAMAAAAAMAFAGPEAAAAAAAKMWTLGKINMAIAAATALGTMAIAPPGGGGGGGTGGGGGGGEGATGIPSGGGGGTTYETHIQIINPLDGADVQRTVEQYIIPALNDAQARNVN